MCLFHRRLLEAIIVVINIYRKKVGWASVVPNMLHVKVIQLLLHRLLLFSTYMWAMSSQFVELTVIIFKIVLVRI